MNPKASIIIPVYNAEHTLRRCVESVVLGLERNIEVILCEDCSKDNSWNVCRQLSEEFENVRCLQNEKNSGVSYTRNAGLAQAKGEYILFVDSDDWVSRNYVKSLYAQAVENPEALVMCSLRFINMLDHSRQDFYWEQNQHAVNLVRQDRFFGLMDGFFIQSPCNKLFRRDVIMDHGIRFDDSLSMGEDFQFVLDYMEAIACKQCIVLNEPLYYYIRRNNASLMSHFGFTENQYDFDRIWRLARLAGQDAEEKARDRIEKTRRNYVYHIARNPRWSKHEKLNAIERLMGDGRALTYYREQRLQFAKEKLAQRIIQVRGLAPRIKGRIQRSLLRKRIARTIRGVNAEGISFISQNCIGGVMYHDLGLPFLSPTINAFIPEPDFVKLVLNLRHYMEQELVMRWGEEYPIGMLEDVQVHFMHYETCREAKEAWEKRKARINWDKIFVIATDRNGFDDAVFADWKKIAYPKVLFTAQKQFTSDADSVYYSEYEGNGFVPDLIPNREFYKDGILTSKVNQVGGHL